MSQLRTPSSWMARLDWIKMLCKLTDWNTAPFSASSPRLLLRLLKIQEVTTRALGQLVAGYYLIVGRVLFLLICVVQGCLVGVIASVGLVCRPASPSCWCYSLSIELLFPGKLFFSLRLSFLSLFNPILSFNEQKPWEFPGYDDWPEPVKASLLLR